MHWYWVWPTNTRLLQHHSVTLVLGVIHKHNQSLQHHSVTVSHGALVMGVTHKHTQSLQHHSVSVSHGALVMGVTHKHTQSLQHHSVTVSHGALVLGVTHKHTQSLQHHPSGMPMCNIPGWRGLQIIVKSDSNPSTNIKKLSKLLNIDQTHNTRNHLMKGKPAKTFSMSLNSETYAHKAPDIWQ